jgi:hypothetical protein
LAAGGFGGGTGCGGTGGVLIAGMGCGVGRGASAWLAACGLAGLPRGADSLACWLKALCVTGAALFFAPGSKTMEIAVLGDGSGGVFFGKVMMKAAMMMACRATEQTAATPSRLRGGASGRCGTSRTRPGRGSSPAEESFGIRRGLAMRAYESLQEFGKSA